MEIIEKRIEELRPYENNPRKNDEAVKYVAESIESFGFKVPLVIAADGVIVAGHTRYKAAKKLKLQTVPCIIVDDLTDQQIKAFRLADNKVAEKAEWDFDLLGLELEGITDIDMSMFDFDLSLTEESKEAEEDNYEVELPDEPKAKPGDVYLLGRHRLMCGDSTVQTDLDKLMSGQQADLLITDPPYNVAYAGKTKDSLTIANDNQSAEDFHALLKDAFTAAQSVIKAGAAFYIWYASLEVVNFHTALEESGFAVRQELIWNKNSLVMGRQDYQWKHEPCLYGWAAGSSHAWYSDRKQTTILNFDKPQANREHPTMKPIKLFDYQIRNSSKAGDNVLDLFGGSGTTLMACEQNGRNAYVMELDAKYIDVIINRWETFTGEKAVKL